MQADTSSLALFHPLIRGWFSERVGEPTEIQARAWPEIAAGRHVLITAPTGSGKTLTAFLWALQQLLTGRWASGQVRVLYVSPLKALNADIRRNLETPLAELRARFLAAGLEPPRIEALTRSGDTPTGERRRMTRRPPEILITTPESLNILLTSRSGQTLLTGLATVIVDEIHAVAGGKRGSHLITAVGRLVPLAGEFQRVGISATVRPLAGIAEFLGGYQLSYVEDEPRFRPRPVSVVRAAGGKRYQLRVEAPAGLHAEADAAEGEEGLWPALAEELRQGIRRHRSTLLFCNSRRLTERMTRLINEGADRDLAYSHHGSLSREIRTVVERRLKDGELAAIVATNSLELGIDIGDLDEVVLIQTPPTIASAIQRVGRAGHGVGQVSRGTLYPTHGRDFLDAAVVVQGILEQDVESLQPVRAPLDVLAQVLVSLCAGERWQLDRLYDQLRTSYPYRHLERHAFDLVIEMLAGRYADSRIRELKPRLSVDRVAGTVRGRDGVARLIYLSGGTIPDRGYYHLRLADTRARLGELDEEFVWERSIGDTFVLGAQAWRIERITHDDVLVRPSRGGASLAPFWRADERDRDFHLSQRVAELLEAANRRVQPSTSATATARNAELAAELQAQACLSASAAAELVDLLRRQKELTGADLPHRHHLLVEHFHDAFGDAGRRQVILHTFWGGRVNRPFAIALAAAWEEQSPHPLEVVQDNDCIVLMAGEEVTAEQVLGLVHEHNLESLLRRKLETTGFFGARFRENAARALLLPRAGFQSRTPLWLHRARSKKLLEAVSRYQDFPVLMETWRTCLQDEFELAPLRQLLGELARGEITVTEVHTRTASPFAAEVIWKQTNRLMYEDDTPESGRASNLRPDLLRELVFAGHLRPRLAPELVATFQAKLQRTAPGYAPRDAMELVDWLQERLLIPGDEWAELLAAVARDGGPSAADLLPELAARALRVTLPGAEPAVAAVERLPRILAALGLEPAGVPLQPLAPDLDGVAARGALASLWTSREAAGEEDGASDSAVRDSLADLLAEWLRCYGPCSLALPGRVFGLDAERLSELLESLAESQRIVIDELTATATEPEVCDAENLEILLRLSRAAARPEFTARPLAELPLFLAVHQGLATPRDSVEALQERLEQLFGYPAPAAAWEAELLPARLKPYYPAWLDSLLQESDCLWFGTGKAKVSLALAGDLDLFLEPPAAAGDPPEADLARLFPDPRGRYDLTTLQQHSGLASAELSEQLWHLAWQGRVSNDTFLALRKGIEHRFQPVPLPATPARPMRRRGLDRWQSSRPFAGSWFVLRPGADGGEELDALEQEELNKDRARQLLARYGILFRELLARELPALQWSRVFRALRLMELSGEVLAGHFFTGVPGLQFISHTAFRRLRGGLPGDAVYWLNAADPASPCGLDVEELKASFPARRASTHLVFQGAQLVLVSQRLGRELELRVGPEHPQLGEYLEVLKVLLSREFSPRKALEVERINGEPAATSPYAAQLGELFSVTREMQSLRLRKRYGP